MSLLWLSSENLRAGLLPLCLIVTLP